MYNRLGLEDELAIGNKLPGPDAQLSFLAAKRVVRFSAQHLVERAHGLDDGATQGHIAAHQVAHRRSRIWLPPIAASDDPTELDGPPVRSGSLPQWLGGTTDSENMWIAIVCEQLAEPIGVGHQHRIQAAEA